LAQDYQDALLLRYSRSPGDLQSHCDGCGQKVGVRHALYYKKGGLVISCHNEIQDELSDLASKALFPSAVCDKPRIRTTCPTEQKTDLKAPSHPVSRNLCKSQGGEWRDILICGLWARRMDCIIDICGTDTDTKSNHSKDPIKVLEAHKWEKNKKSLKNILEQHHQFTPFVVSTDGLIDKEAKTLLKKLYSLLAEK
jgi:hypothetical protein